MLTKARPDIAPVPSLPNAELATPGTATSAFAKDWWTAAACRNDNVDADLFFSEELTEIAAAKRICMTCPVMAPCLEEALERAEPCGVWGGQLLTDGRIVTIKRRRGRPPKVPRPEDQFPMVPIPDHLKRLIA